MFGVYIAIVILLFLYYIKWCQSYWQRNNVPSPKCEFFFGHVRDVISGRIPKCEYNYQMYKVIKKSFPNVKYAGLYFFWKPIYIPMDPHTIKLILQKDFAHFTDHGIPSHPKDILSRHLFNLEGSKWRELRAKVTPNFSSSKLKIMFDTILEKTVCLERILRRYANNEEICNIKDITSRFTIDVIGSCAFGIECNSLEDEKNVMLEYSKKILKQSVFKFWLRFLVPENILANLGFKIFGADITNFYSSLVKETIKIREETKICRKDFMELLIKLKHQPNAATSLTVNEIIAQCFIIFLAGFETSANTIMFTLYEFAKNTTIQTKVRNEINIILKEHNNQITYESVMKMEYLENCINETLRKYPPLANLPRICTKDYHLPNTDLKIKKGTRVEIPVWGVQKDPNYFPNPEMYDPDRFLPENVAKRPDFTFLPFGEGPRMCLGMRFGILQTKLALITFIKNFQIVKSEKTKEPLKMENNSFTLSVQGDIFLNLIKN